jgi:hypothetical protein
MEIERGEHWCSIMVGTKEDRVLSSSNRYGQVERDFQQPEKGQHCRQPDQLG